MNIKITNPKKFCNVKINATTTNYHYNKNNNT